MQSQKRTMLNKTEQTSGFQTNRKYRALPAVNTVECLDFLSEHRRCVLQVQGYGTRKVPLDSAGDAEAFVKTSGVTYLEK